MKKGRERLELESRTFEVLNLSLEERKVGVSHARGLKKKEKGLAFKRNKGLDLGLMVDNNVTFVFGL